MLKLNKHDNVTAPAGQPGLLAPDTSGMNFYRADPALTDLLRIHLPDLLFRHVEPHLDRLGALAGGHLDECARLADRHVPVLHQRDRYGRDAQWIEYHPAYRELERAAFGEFGIHAMSIRKGILGWPEKYPVVAKHAFTFLFNQAEFGLGCPINVTDGCAKLLANFGSEALKARYLDGLTQTDMSKLTQGGQFMTEKEGGSDVGKLTTIAVQEGDHWRLSGEKWFCSNADAEVVMLLSRPEVAAGAARIEEATCRHRAGDVDGFCHGGRAGSRGGGPPGCGGAAAYSDADPEIPCHPRCPKSLWRPAGDARRHRLHRGIRHRAAV